MEQKHSRGAYAGTWQCYCSHLADETPGALHSCSRRGVPRQAILLLLVFPTDSCTRVHLGVQARTSNMLASARGSLSARRLQADCMQLLVASPSSSCQVVLGPAFVDWELFLHFRPLCSTRARLSCTGALDCRACAGSGPPFLCSSPSDSMLHAIVPPFSDTAWHKFCMLICICYAYCTSKASLLCRCGPWQGQGSSGREQ